MSGGEIQGTRFMTLKELSMHHKSFKDTIAASPCIFTLGVAGDSGSGKTTFTQGIRSIFGDDLVSTITLDDYHSLDRAGRTEQGITALDPRANRIEQLERDLILLKQEQDEVPFELLNPVCPGVQRRYSLFRSPGPVKAVIIVKGNS